MVCLCCFLGNGCSTPGTSQATRYNYVDIELTPRHGLTCGGMRPINHSLHDYLRKKLETEGLYDVLLYCSADVDPAQVAPVMQQLHDLGLKTITVHFTDLRRVPLLGGLPGPFALPLLGHDAWQIVDIDVSSESDERKDNQEKKNPD